MQYSTNYHMNKPELNEQYRLEHWNDNTDILDSELKKVNNRILTFITNNRVLSGEQLEVGHTVKILFTVDVMGTDESTVLSINYNETNIPVKVNCNGALVNFVAREIQSNTFKYLQAYTTLELIYDGTQFIIVGNPKVLSGSGYTVYADGKVGNDAIGFIKSTMESTPKYGWLNLCADTADRTVLKTKYADLLTWATENGLYGNNKPFKDATDTNYFIIPDFKELSLKGIGLTSKANNHVNTNGLSIGEFIDDRIKSHNHGLTVIREGVSGAYYDYQGTNMAFPGISGSSTVWKTYATSGSGYATNEVKSIGVNYFIKCFDGI